MSIISYLKVVFLVSRFELRQSIDLISKSSCAPDHDIKSLPHPDIPVLQSGCSEASSSRACDVSGVDASSPPSTDCAKQRPATIPHLGRIGAGMRPSRRRESMSRRECGTLSLTAFAVSPAQDWLVFSCCFVQHAETPECAAYSPLYRPALPLPVREHALTGTTRHDGSET